MALKSKMPLQVWILTLSAFAVGTAEFVIAGVLPQVAGYIANALGGLIGGVVVDSSFGASAIPFVAAIVPLVGLLFILTQERHPGGGPALSPRFVKIR
jgi:predicted MFS family arabinose efflux permease